MTDPSDTKREIVAARPWFSDADVGEILAALERVLRSGRLIPGERTEAFESAFHDDIGVAISSRRSGNASASGPSPSPSALWRDSSDPRCAR